MSPSQEKVEETRRSPCGEMAKCRPSVPMDGSGSGAPCHVRGFARGSAPRHRPRGTANRLRCRTTTGSSRTEHRGAVAAPALHRSAGYQGDTVCRIVPASARRKASDTPIRGHGRAAVAGRIGRRLGKRLVIRGGGRHGTQPDGPRASRTASNQPAAVRCPRDHRERNPNAARPYRAFGDAPFGAPSAGTMIRSVFAFAEAPAKEGNILAVRRPGGRQIHGAIRGQSKGSPYVQKLYVNVEIVLVFSIPRKGDLLAVRRETRETTPPRDRW